MALLILCIVWQFVRLLLWFAPLLPIPQNHRQLDFPDLYKQPKNSLAKVPD